MNLPRIFVFTVVSVLVAILLASVLNSYTRVSDSALAEIAPTATPRKGVQFGYIPRGLQPSRENAPTIPTAKRDYLPIIFLNSANAGGAWLLAGNAGTNPANDFLGTTDNVTLTMRVSNTIAYRIIPAVDPCCGFAPNIIGGFSGNSIAAGLAGSTIAGGGESGYPNIIAGTGNNATIGGGDGNAASGSHAFIGGGDGNTASGDRATVGAGYGNTTSGNFATIGGGESNTIQGGDTSYSTISGGLVNGISSDRATIGGGVGNTASKSYATIGGGGNNTASGVAATIGGGGYNTASNNNATVGGGGGNIASGFYSTIPGGNFNSATMSYTLAAGNQAQALHQGAFVWADSTNAPFASTANDQFLIRANGGVGINTTYPSATLSVFAYTSSTVNNTAVFYDPAIGPNYSHIHYGTAGDWYIRSASNSGKVVIQDSGGNVGIGTASPSASYKLDVNGKIRATGFFGTCRTDGVVASGPFCNQDFAEGFATIERTDPGDLVALVSKSDSRIAPTPTVHKSTNAYDELVIGVVSQNPGLVFDNGQTHLAGDNSQLITNDKTVVALVGRVQVKVSVENGVISIGDPLTSSSQPGIAMKATQAGKIIGYAMESTTKDGMVLALVQPGDYIPPAELNALKQNAQLEVRVAALEQEGGMNANASSPSSSNWVIAGALIIVAFVIGRRWR